MRANRKTRVAERNAGDAVSEMKHRMKAGVERGKRAVAGGAMTTRQKTASVVKETANRTAAQAARTRRQLRKEMES